MNQDEIVKQVKRQAPDGWSVGAGLGGALMINKTERMPATSDDLDNEIVKTILIMGDETEKIEVSVNFTMYFDDDASFNLMADQIKKAPTAGYEVDSIFDVRNLTIEYSLMAFIKPGTSVGESVAFSVDEAKDMMVILRKASDTKILRGLN